ncbi:pca operon transcription factor PcaQ [Acidocella sp.]|uniref:pca operon transcription factor PcaQ n=1 Tax=Acidocella sp. TaxID=50710 RepID=UPI003CFFB0DF
MPTPRGEGLDPRIKLRHLSVFLEVVRLSSVVHAAESLGLTQPALSKTIAELEAILRVKLFDRSGRTLKLTGFGEMFHRYAGASLTALKQGVRSMAQVRRDEAAAFAIGALPTVSARILPRAAAAFTARNPAFKPRIVTGPNAYLLSQLRLGEVEFVLGRMAEPEMMRGFAFEHLYEEEIALVVRPDHPLLAASRFDLADIAHYQLLMPPPGSIIRPTAQHYLIAHALGPFAGEIETISDNFARAYVRASNAVWIISEGVVAEELAHGFLARLPADTSATRGPVGLTTRTDLQPSMPAQIFAQSVRAAVAALAVHSPSDQSGAKAGLTKR